MGHPVSQLVERNWLSPLGLVGGALGPGAFEPLPAFSKYDPEAEGLPYGRPRHTMLSPVEDAAEVLPRPFGDFGDDNEAGGNPSVEVLLKGEQQMTTTLERLWHPATATTHPRMLMDGAGEIVVDYFSFVPDELIVKILSYLDLADRLVAAGTCSRFYSLAQAACGGFEGLDFQV